LENTYLGTGKVVILSSLALLPGFLCFSFLDFGGAYSMGVLTVAGIICSGILSLTILPVLLLLLHKKGQEF